MMDTTLRVYSNSVFALGLHKRNNGKVNFAPSWCSLKDFWAILASEADINKQKVSAQDIALARKLEEFVEEHLQSEYFANFSSLTLLETVVNVLSEIEYLPQDAIASILNLATPAQAEVINLALYLQKLLDEQNQYLPHQLWKILIEFFSSTPSTKEPLLGKWKRVEFVEVGFIERHKLRAIKYAAKHWSSVDFVFRFFVPVSSTKKPELFTALKTRPDLLQVAENIKEIGLNLEFVPVSAKELDFVEFVQCDTPELESAVFVERLGEQSKLQAVFCADDETSQRLLQQASRANKQGGFNGVFRRPLNETLFFKWFWTPFVLIETLPKADSLAGWVLLFALAQNGGVNSKLRHNVWQIGAVLKANLKTTDFILQELPENPSVDDVKNVLVNAISGVEFEPQSEALALFAEAVLLLFQIGYGSGATIVDALHQYWRKLVLLLNHAVENNPSLNAVHELNAALIVGKSLSELKGFASQELQFSDVWQWFSDLGKSAIVKFLDSTNEQYISVLDATASAVALSVNSGIKQVAIVGATEESLPKQKQVFAVGEYLVSAAERNYKQTNKDNRGFVNRQDPMADAIGLVNVLKDSAQSVEVYLPEIALASAVVPEDIVADIPRSVVVDELYSLPQKHTNTYFVADYLKAGNPASEQSPAGDNLRRQFAYNKLALMEERFSVVEVLKELLEHNASEPLCFAGVISCNDTAYTKFKVWLEEREKDGFSPSLIENYYRCPFKFFLINVLKVKAPEEEIIAPERWEEGVFVHKVLRNYWQEKIEELGNKPVKISNLNFDKEVKRLRELVDELFDTSDFGIWKGLRFSIYNNAKYFLMIDREVSANRAVVAVEFPYTSTVVFNGEEVKLNCRFDRIDVDSDGENEYARIVDYKYKDKDSVSDYKFSPNFPEKGGLQLPLYLWFARNVLSDKGIKGKIKPKAFENAKLDIYYLGGRADLEKGKEKLYEDFQDNLEELVAVAVKAIRKGIFVPFINGNNCNKCNYKEICRKQYI